MWCVSTEIPRRFAVRASKSATVEPEARNPLPTKNWLKQFNNSVHLHIISQSLVMYHIDIQLLIEFD